MEERGYEKLGLAVTTGIVIFAGIMASLFTAWMFLLFYGEVRERVVETECPSVKQGRQP